MQIHWRNPQGLEMDERDALEDKIRALAAGHNDLIDLWVDITEESHHRKGSAKAALRAQVRRAELVARGEGADLSLALRDALLKFERELRDLRARRADRRPDFGSVPPLRGVIDRVMHSDDYGFLTSESGERVYFHRNSVGGGLDFSALQGGESIAFNIEAGEEGAQATIVVPVPGPR